MILISLSYTHAVINISQYDVFRPGYYNMMYNRLLVLLLIIHLILIVHFHKKGKYHSKKFAIRHTKFAIIFPVIGFFIMPFSYDFVCLKYFVNCYYFEGFLTVFLIYGFLIYVATLPYWVNRFQ